MSLRRSAIAGYLSQFYVTGLGLLMVPLYLRYLGAEAYGLVGFFTMLQAWIQLLDMGLSPTLAREIARFRGGARSSSEVRLLVFAMEAFFFGTAFLAGLVLAIASDTIATSWLNPNQLSVGEVHQAIFLMAAAVPLRWISGLYRGAINGFERQVFLGGVNAGVATLRFVGVVVAMDWWGATAKVFFIYQLLVALLELCILAATVHVLLPSAEPGAYRARWRDIRSAFRFSVGVSATGVIWIFLTQADKLLLSKLLPLAEYGYVALAVAVAGGINIVVAPLSQILMPRMTKLVAQGLNADVIRLYRLATRYVSLIVGAICGALVFCPGSVLFAWTGNLEAARGAERMLMWYAIGNVLLAFAAFPYYMQFARGHIRLHLIGNLLLLLLMLPGVWFLTGLWGGVGGGIAWCIALLLYLSIWVTYSHVVLLPKHAARWLFYDVALFLVPSVVVVYVVDSLVNRSGIDDRWSAASIGFIELICGFLVSFLMFLFCRRREIDGVSFS